MMRTTLNLDDEVLEAARSLAESTGRPLGAVVSELARRGLRPRTDAMEVQEGFPVFAVPEDAAPLTPEQVRTALDDDG